MVRRCRLCLTRPVPDHRLAHRDYRCNACRSQYASHKAAAQRYNTSPRGRELHRRRSIVHNPKRIFIGRTYHSAAASVEQAQHINVHVKEKLNAFKGQQAGTEA